MRQCWLVCVVLATCFSLVYSWIDFEECGGDPVSSVQITGCTIPPCMLRRGETYNIFITMDYIYPIVDSVVVDTDIIQYGANFKQETVINNPCIYGCPVVRELEEAKYDINVRVSQKLIAMPGHMEINGTYYEGNKPTSGFCILLFVDII